MTNASLLTLRLKWRSEDAGYTWIYQPGAQCAGRYMISQRPTKWHIPKTNGIGIGVDDVFESPLLRNAQKFENKSTWGFCLSIDLLVKGLSGFRPVREHRVVAQ
jgi:hypothetical protein